jgi:hypothetical protein
MKKMLLYALLSILSCYEIYSQTTTNQSQVPAEDSLKLGLKWKNAPIYVRSMPFAIYTGAGKLSDRVAPEYRDRKVF